MVRTCNFTTRDREQTHTETFSKCTKNYFNKSFCKKGRIMCDANSTICIKRKICVYLEKIQELCTVMSTCNPYTGRKYTLSPQVWDYLGNIETQPKKYTCIYIYCYHSLPSGKEDTQRGKRLKSFLLLYYYDTLFCTFFIFKHLL